MCFEPRIDSSSSSIIVLSARLFFCACTGEVGGLYVVAGRKSKVAMMSIENYINYILLFYRLGIVNYFFRDALRVFV
jgi:hypothetical protein